MRTRLRALHWRSAGETAVLYASIGVVLMSLFGLHNSTVVIVFGSQTAVWTVFALIGRSGPGLMRQRDDDWPRPPLKWRTFLIGLAIYAVAGVGSIAQAVVYASETPAFSVVLAINAAVIATIIAVTYRRMLPRRRDDIII